MLLACNANFIHEKFRTAFTRFHSICFMLEESIQYTTTDVIYRIYFTLKSRP